MCRYLFLLGLFSISVSTVTGQISEDKLPKPLQVYLSKDSTSYLKFSGLGQFWVRYNENNPGSTLNGYAQSESYDVGIRRLRFVAQGQLLDRIRFYSQVGLNNLNDLSARKQGLFVHDAWAEVKAVERNLFIGVGLHGWGGTSRYASSSVNSILGMDLPLIHESTNDITDQFGRKFGVYAKGKLSKLDYRLSVSKPLPVHTALIKIDELKAGEYNQSYFARTPSKLNFAGYTYFAFLDEEQHFTPYMVGSYLGKKKVLNIGLGFQTQRDAFWYLEESNDTVFKPLRQFGADVFYDSYLNDQKKNAITAYVSYLSYYFGPNYTRNIGVMNVANGVNQLGTFNGPGNAVPLIGTGNIVYSQIGYKFKDNLLKRMGTIQPYAAVSFAQYQRFASVVDVYAAGVNWLILGNMAKLSLDYQNRPIFMQDQTNVVAKVNGLRLSQVVLQFQISI